ncbi:MAG: hypothetical protein HY037_00720 [Nitrospirae bacterium]|nr:hypothetical protein [Candidatus Troglogloeales bacterium]
MLSGELSQIPLVVTTAIISLAKSVSALTVNPNGTLDYTINYTNVGVTSTTGVAVTINGGASVDRHVVRDLIPTNTTFTSFLGTPTPAGGQTVFHVTNAGEHVYVTANPGAGLFDAVAYLFSTALTGGQSGVFSLQVTVNGTAQVGNITNTAVMHFNNGLGATSQSSNTTVSSVNLIPSVTIGDSTVATGNAGSVVSFTNLVTNNGNGADRFNITVVNGNFPSGTTFSFFNADGVTPLLDTNGDGIPDTGSMNAAATLDIVMKAAIPANASNTGAPFNATVTALSVASPFPSDTGTETLSAIVGPGVDLTVPATFSGDPGTTVSVVLNVHNTGPNPDSFNLQFSNAGGGSFSPGLLPSNMTAIQFFQGSSGSPTGAPLTSTGQLPAGTSTEIIARVTISTTGAGGATSTLFIRAVSVASGALDTESTLFTLNTIRGITLLQNQNGQASAGSATTYSHVLKNVGNVTESQINLAATNSQPGFLTTIYLDNGGDGLINGADAVITSVTNLAAGASTFLIIRVAVPSSAANGAVDSGQHDLCSQLNESDWIPTPPNLDGWIG